MADTIKELRAKLEAAAVTEKRCADMFRDFRGTGAHRIADSAQLFAKLELAGAFAKHGPALLAVAEAAEEMCAAAEAEGPGGACVDPSRLRAALASLASLTRNDEVERDV